jgi:type I restriction enzyme M protein
VRSQPNTYPRVLQSHFCAHQSTQRNPDTGPLSTAILDPFFAAADILVLKKCKKPDDVLFINASEHFEKSKRQNRLLDEHIEKIVSTYQFRNEEPRYSRRVSMKEITENNFNLNISRYISTAVAEEEIDLGAVNAELVSLENDITAATEKHNAFLKELGLPLLPSVGRRPSGD